MSPRHTSALTLEHVLLALLDQKPMHGYELYQELCALKGISLVWNISQASLYAILDKLEAKGYLSSQLVQGETYPPRKYFRLTGTGKETLQVWIKTPVRRARALRQEFLAKLIVAHRYGKSYCLDLIHAQQIASRTWEDELHTNIPPLDLDHLDEWLVYSFRANRVENIQNWLKQLEQELDRILAPESH